VITLTGVSKSFDGEVVLSDVSFTVEPGQIVGFVGANGSGKTTTMRAIMGLLPLSSGKIKVDGTLVNSVNKTSRSLGYLPEERGLYTNDSVENQLHFFGELQGMTMESRDLRIEYLLERLGVQKYRKSKLRDLSLGNQQRVQVAVAALHSPKYFIFDEPFSGLDPTGIRTLRDFISEESDKGVGAIFSSHIIPFVEEISHKILVLSGGKISTYDGVSGSLSDFFKSLEDKHVQ
jgi:ABC-2 type transport system ATP-binding protein